MKVLVQKQQLLEAINIVQKAILQKATLPELEGIYIEAGAGLRLVGNCFELGMDCLVEADILEAGRIVVHSKVFGEIIRKLPDSIIEIVCEQNRLVRISCMSSVFEIKGMDADAYPLPPVHDETMVVTIGQGALRDMIRQTIFAVGTDDNRKVMTGILFELKEGELSLISLDGFRMAVSRTLIKQDVVGRVIIPGKNMNEILKVLDNSEEEVRIVISGALVTFSLKNTKIVSKTIEGEFMNYKSYVPAQFETVLTVKAKELEECLERASLMTADDKRYPVKFSVRGDEVTISTNAELGFSKETLIASNEGGDMNIGFNPKYLIDSLKVIGDQTVRFSLSSQVGPSIITPLEGEKYLFLILPVRIKT